MFHRESLKPIYFLGQKVKIQRHDAKECCRRGLGHGTLAWASITGDRGTSPPEFGVNDANANCPPIFCYCSKFYAPDCLHYNAVMQ